MDWNAAIEKNREALKRVLAGLVAMAGLAIGQSSSLSGRRRTGETTERVISPLVGEMPGRAEGGAVPPASPPVSAVSNPEMSRSFAPPSGLPPISPTRGEITRSAIAAHPETRDEGEPRRTLPRHLHRAVLRLLRPAEAAARRLLIVAARGIEVTLPPVRVRGPKAGRPPARVTPTPRVVPAIPTARPSAPHDDEGKGILAEATSQSARGFALFDPLRRERVRRVSPAFLPRISVSGFTVPAPGPGPPRADARGIPSMPPRSPSALPRSPPRSMICPNTPGASQLGKQGAMRR